MPSVASQPAAPAAARRGSNGPCPSSSEPGAAVCRVLSDKGSSTNLLSGASVSPNLSHYNVSGPRPPTLTQGSTVASATASQGTTRAAGVFARFGRKRFKHALLLEQMEDDCRHPRCDDGNGGVGTLAAVPRLPIDSSKIRVAAHRHPGGLDEGPLQPLVARADHLSVIGLSAAAGGRRSQARVAEQLLRAGKAPDPVELGKDHRSDDGPDPGNAQDTFVVGTSIELLGDGLLVLLDANFEFREQVEIL